MALFDDIGQLWTRYRGYFLGKAALMLAVGGASSLLGISILWPALVIVGGGMALHAYGLVTQQRYYQQDMVDLYRDDIADHLGIAPEQVTRAHLKEAAKDNEVIAQALERQHKKTFIDIGTSLLSGAVSFALLLSFADAGQFLRFAKETFSDALGPIVNFIGLSTVSSVSGLVLHDALGLAIDVKTGVSKAAAHDLIIAMDRDVRHGRPISREQVYGVLVAGNSQLQQAIATRFHKSYRWMNAAEQSNVLHQIGVAEELDVLAQQINRGEIRPGRLAYMMDDDALADMRARHAHTAPSPTPTVEAAPEQGKFVTRLGRAQHQSEDFVKQVLAGRQAAGSSSPAL
ncbi:MAG: hypothetical protein SFW64_03745 [Alphaproteobacteria bacterium]|nr:hypothetical protein [Alphaproteobacteria bacterium]